MPSSSLLAVYLFAFAVSIGAVVSPGPVSAAIISEAPRQGWRVGPLVASGHSVLELIITALLGYGLHTAIGVESIRRVIAIAGGVVLLLLGGSYLIGAWRGSIRLPEAGEKVAPRSPARLVLLGVVTTASNPFWYAWWMTVAAGYLVQARSLGPAAIGAFFLGHVSADYGWDTFLAVATGTGRQWLNPPRYRWLITVTGGFMLYLGALFLRSGFGNA